MSATTRPSSVLAWPGSCAYLPREAFAPLRELGVRASVGAPVVVHGELWGAVVGATKDASFPRGAEQRLAAFAELVAQALANAEAREELAASRKRLVEAAQVERRRLERNLHDGAQQRLVGLSMTLRLAERQQTTEAAARTLTRAASCVASSTASRPWVDDSRSKAPSTAVPRCGRGCQRSEDWGCRAVASG